VRGGAACRNRTDDLLITRGLWNTDRDRYQPPWLLDDRRESPTPGRVATVRDHVGDHTVHCGETACDDWLAVPDRPYAPASPSTEGFIPCSPDEAATLANASDPVSGPAVVVWLTCSEAPVVSCCLTAWPGLTLGRIVLSWLRSDAWLWGH
jgi:hypothetical protein